MPEITYSTVQLKKNTCGTIGYQIKVITMKRQLDIKENVADNEDSFMSVFSTGDRGLRYKGERVLTCSTRGGRGRRNILSPLMNSVPRVIRFICLFPWNQWFFSITV